MSNKTSMKTGFVPNAYMPPKDIKLESPFEILKWQLNELAKMGGAVLNGGFRFPEKQDEKEEIKQILTEKNLEIEFYAAPFMGLAGSDSKEAREAVISSIKRSKEFGNKILRSAYNGRLEYKRSRFNKEIPLKEHLRLVIENLKEMAQIFESEGVYLAVENHCDFTGKDFAEIFSAVNSKHIGSGLDTGNSYTVYADPIDDAEALAEYTFSTHIKDMMMMEMRTGLGLIPLQARGCAIGDGNIDIPYIIDLLDKKSPFASGLRLIIEQGWMYVPEGIDSGQYNRDCLLKGMKYLNGLLGH